MKRELLIGSGRVRDKRLYIDPNDSGSFENLTTLDYNADHKPDVVWDLHNLPLPFKAGTFDEIHAYEVLEHVGGQGDYKTFFAQFTEFHRLLKDGGHFFATVPSRNSVWAWGDPSHTRVIQKEHLHFLHQFNYENEVGRTSMSDFRNIYKVDFLTVWTDDDGHSFRFILKKL